MTIVVTGGVACGKSHASKGLCGLLGEQALLFSSDAVVHQLLDQPEVIKTVCGALGDRVSVDESGRLNRSALRELVLGNPVSREQLESVLHPLVFKRFEEIRRVAESGGGTKVLVAEVPLFYEVGSLPDADMVVVVAASPPTQIERMRLHRGLSESAAVALIGAQMATMDKVSHSDRVIWNDGGIDALDAQVRLVALEIQTT